MAISVSYCAATSSWCGSVPRAVLSSTVTEKIHVAVVPALECRGQDWGRGCQGCRCLCSGLKGGPKTFVQVPIPETCQCDLFGKTVFTDVIKLKISQ